MARPHRPRAESQASVGGSAALAGGEDHRAAVDEISLDQRAQVVHDVKEQTPAGQTIP
jgi:hypothetical protein